MTRKIISIRSDFAYIMPQLPIKLLEQDKDINGMIFPAGSVDIEWEKEKIHIELFQHENKTYYSVPIEMTLDLLNESINLNGESSIEDYDIKDEDNLGSDFVNLLFSERPLLINKYREDNTYLTYLGNLPEAPEFLVVEEPPSEEETNSVGIQTS
jgi:hypothetical protein